eukprot:1143252-Pelagomonas_calceolata.AAC.2
MNWAWVVKFLGLAVNRGCCIPGLGLCRKALGTGKQGTARSETCCVFKGKELAQNIPAAPACGAGVPASFAGNKLAPASLPVFAPYFSFVWGPLWDIAVSLGVKGIKPGATSRALAGSHHGALKPEEDEARLGESQETIGGSGEGKVYIAVPSCTCGSGESPVVVPGGPLQMSNMLIIGKESFTGLTRMRPSLTGSQEVRLLACS